jgi:hypothetical protein
MAVIAVNGPLGALARIEATGAQGLDRAVSGRSGEHYRTAQFDPEPSFRLTRRCSILELALADEASEPTIRQDTGLPPIVRTAPGYSNPVEYPRIFGGIDLGHT